MPTIQTDIVSLALAYARPRKARAKLEPVEQSFIHEHHWTPEDSDDADGLLDAEFAQHKLDASLGIERIRYDVEDRCLLHGFVAESPAGYDGSLDFKKRRQRDPSTGRFSSELTLMDETRELMLHGIEPDAEAPVDITELQAHDEMFV